MFSHSRQRLFYPVAALAAAVLFGAGEVLGPLFGGVGRVNFISPLGTQALLADTVRSSERLRLAHDLHDAVGHHLTALNLHL